MGSNVEWINWIIGRARAVTYEVLIRGLIPSTVTSIVVFWLLSRSPFVDIPLQGLITFSRILCRTKLISLSIN